MKLQLVLRIIAVLLFLVVAAGQGTFEFGSIHLSLLGAGLAAFAASFIEWK